MCENCQFNNTGRCHRHAPIAIDKHGDGVFPKIDQWRTFCGDGESIAAEELGAQPLQQTTTVWSALRKWLKRHFSIRQTLDAMFALKHF